MKMLGLHQRQPRGFLATFPTHRRAYAVLLIRHINALGNASFGLGSIDDPFLDICRQAVESFFDIDVALC